LREALKENLDMSGKHAIVMDFDGTLVDTMDGFADVAARVISSRYPTDRTTAREAYLRTSGIPFRQQLDVMYPGDRRNDDAADEFEQGKLDGFFSETFSDDALDAVSSLRGIGLLVIVSSNNFQHLVDEFVARASNIEFDLVLGARDNFFKGADHFRAIMERLGLVEDDMTFVGDSLKDAERALSCGVGFIGKLGTFTRDDFHAEFPGIPTVELLMDLLDIVESPK